eukprot:306202-Prymnesium_polylepis.1
MPAVSSLMGERLDIYCNYDLDEGGSEGRWCTGGRSRFRLHVNARNRACGIEKSAYWTCAY